MNKPLFALGVSMAAFAIFLLWSVSAVAQAPEDAPVLLMNFSVKTQFTSDPTGVVPVIVTKEAYDNWVLEGEIIGYIFDASVPMGPYATRHPVFYHWDGPGSAVRMCDMILYEANIPDWDGLVPAYVFGSTSMPSCPGPMPIFEDDAALPVWTPVR